MVVAVALLGGGLIIVSHWPSASSGATAPAGANSHQVPTVTPVSKSAMYEGPASEASADPAELTTSVTLLPAGQSVPISSVSNGTNVFIVTFVANGTEQTAYLGDAPLRLSTDQGTNVTISDTSRYLGLLNGVAWELDSDGIQATFASGSSVTLYYYNVVDEPAYYSVVDGGSPPIPVLTYSSAPVTPSSTGLPTTYNVNLTMLSHGIWPLVGTTASVTNPVSANATVRWATETSSWTLTAPFQIPGPVAYYHQYYVSLQYTVSGGGTGYSAPSVSCPSFGGSEFGVAGTSIWIDAGRGDSLSNCAFPQVLPGSSQTQRWSLQSESVLIQGPGVISQQYVLQYPLTVQYSLVGEAPESPPTITSIVYGAPATISLPANMSVVWLDSGSPYSLSNPLPLSNSTERWITTAATTGTMDQAESVQLTFYQQFLLSASYSVVGGGAPVAPSLSYTSFGTPESATLTSNAQSFWADGGSSYSAPSVLSGSNSTSRWYSPNTAGVANRSIQLAPAYHHQYLFTITGGGLGSQWFDVNAIANVTIQGVYGRVAGVGQRVTSYALDGQPAVSVTPTDQNLSISVIMSSTHELSISSVAQYQLSLDEATLSAARYITPPTIAGDRYWYDYGSNVTVVLNGIWGRDNGTGNRLASYTLNGLALMQVATTGTVTALSVGSITSPQALTSTIVTQYYVTISSGSLVSLSQPPISGDTGWYDQGTVVNGTFYNSWNVIPNQSRLNAVGYTMNGGQETQLTRSGSGTFVIPLPVSEPLNVSVASVTQFYLAISGDPAAQPTVPSPTGDGYFDAGTKLQVTTPNTFGVVNGTSRQRVVSFTLGGEVMNVTRITGSTSTPAFSLNSTQQVSFATVTQYLISFHFTDYSGLAIAPRSFTVSLSGGAENLTASKSWFDSGSRFTVTSIDWEGVEVPSVGSPGLRATSPQPLTVQTEVYQASLKVTDLLGFPVSGAQVTVTFGNKSSTTLLSGDDGSVSLGLLPAVNYEAAAAGFAGTTNVSVDPATDANAVVNVTWSNLTVGIIAAVVLLVIAASSFVLIRRSRSRRSGV